MTTPSPPDGLREEKRRMQLKTLIVQMNDANNGLCGMALLAGDPSNLNKYSEKFMNAYHAALDLLEKP